MYREVTMIEVREVLRRGGEGLPKKRIAAQPQRCDMAVLSRRTESWPRQRATSWVGLIELNFRLSSLYFSQVALCVLPDSPTTSRAPTSSPAMSRDSLGATGPRGMILY